MPGEKNVSKKYIFCLVERRISTLYAVLYIGLELRGCGVAAGDGRLLAASWTSSCGRPTDFTLQLLQPATIFPPVFDAGAAPQLRHRDVMWTAVLLCACATTAVVTSSPDLDGERTPGQAWADNRVSGHPVG